MKKVSVFFLMLVFSLAFVTCKDKSSPECGDGVCEGNEDETNCIEDCGECGDGICAGDENVENCIEDCGECGDGICAGDEDETNCIDDCGVCGDGICSGNEDYFTCLEDCPMLSCGNGICEGGEESTCPEDCQGQDNCGNGVCEIHETTATCPEDCEATKKVDLLILIDNSPSMANEQQQLKNAFPSLYSALQSQLTNFPDLHIGVVTPDLGTGNYTSFYACEEFGGDKGILGKAGEVDLGETCLGAGQRYMVDVEPQGCSIERGTDGQCLSHDCNQGNCDGIAQSNETLTFVENENGCPRCRNFAGTPEETFSCIADVGVGGCGFEQQLEAMDRALNVDETPENEGFLRDDALLAILIITDEDDCSASRPDIIFNPDSNEDRIDSTLGFIHSFRCFEFGVTCDINDRTIEGPRSECVPREDEAALLFKIERYGAYLSTLKDPGRVVVTTIAAPVPEEIVVEFDEQNRPTVQPSCTDNLNEGATPGIRIQAFCSYFNSPTDLSDWAYASVCENSFEVTLESLGLEIAQRLGQ